MFKTEDETQGLNGVLGAGAANARAPKLSLFQRIARVSAPLGLLAIVSACSASPAGDEPDVAATKSSLSAVSVTQGGDELRTSWYSDEAALNPSVVAASSFGQSFSTVIDGEVDAQPLVWQSTVLVATETNHVYGLDSRTGSILWTDAFGTAFSSSDIGCADVSPSIGIAGTPVIDRTTNIAYLFSKAYVTGASGNVAWYMHALAVTTGQEQPGFPVLIAGSASNDATQVFAARKLLQRPGLLLLDGVVYAGFGGHCDIAPYAGWIVGVSIAGQVKTLFTTQAGPNRTDGAGVWASGGGLVSDGSGQILFSTGNGGSIAGPVAGNTPPGTLGEMIVRATVQPNGNLAATDFFSPYDAIPLDVWDGDFGSGGPMGLPSPYFGTTAHPHLLVAQGKEGYLYLLDRENLGGIGNGPSGGDAVLNRTGPYGGMWSKPAVWPGNGGYVYLPTASGAGGQSAGGAFGSLQVFKYGVDGTGTPSLAFAGASTDAFGFTSSSPIVTSDGTTSGSALVWIVWSPDGTGNGAQLRAYQAVPSAGAPIKVFSAPIGRSAKFTPPGVGGGRIYVGTRDGHVLGFGSPVVAPLAGNTLDFGYVLLGSSAQATMTVTANSAVTVSQVTSSSSDFVVGAGLALPVTLAAGQTLGIPVTFTPAAAGPRAGALALATDQGPVSFAVSGQGQSADPSLTVTPPTLSFGGVAVGSQAAESITISNTGGVPLAIDNVLLPGSPFGATGAPTAGAVLGLGDAITMTATFSPTATGMFTGSIELDTSVGVRMVQLSGSSAAGGKLVISPLAVNFGPVAVGSYASTSFTVSNLGGTAIQITKSKPPVLGAFSALTALAEGTVIPPSTTLTEYVSFVPASVGPIATDTWVFNANDGSGLQTVAFDGTGTVDITAAGTPIALVPQPTGGGNPDIGVIRDGVMPAQTTSNESLQWDDYTGTARAEDWIGYSYPTLRNFNKVLFQEGMSFVDGGWFETLRVQVRQSGTWVDVPNLTVTPVYPGINDGVSFETYALTFPDITGDAIRIDGKPGGSAGFMSVGELRIFGALSSVNVAPVANAGAAQTIGVGSVVTLDGSASADPNGDAITYAWTQTSGPAVTLSSSTAQKPTFTAPTVTAPTTIGFSLVVSDGSLFSSAASATVTVVVANNATYTDITASGTVVALITAPTGGGSKSTAVIHDGVTPAQGSANSAQQYDTYTGAKRTEDWIGYTFAAPQTFGKVVFEEGLHFVDGGWFTTLKVQIRQGGVWVDVPNLAASPSYPGINTGISYETYTFTFPLTTGDGIRIDGPPGGSATFMSIGELRVFSGTTGGAPPPTANAGANQSVASSATVNLDGSGSADPGGHALTYTWTQTSGPAVTLSSTTAQKPTFSAPSVTVATALGFSLVVNNGSSSSSAATVTVTVAAVVVNLPPTASAGANQSVASSALVTLDGSGSSDPAGKALTYAWTQTSGPAVTLSSTTAQKPTFSAPSVTVATALGFSLVVNNGSSSSSAATVTVTVAAVVVNLPPTASAGANQSISSAALVTLDGSGSADPNGDALTYAWTQTSGPVITLSRTTAQKPTFVAPTVNAVATIGFNLVVSDGSLLSNTASVTITVNPAALADVTANGTAVALITAPTGGGSKSTAVIHDGVTPAQGSSNAAQEYDTYTGGTRTEDWIGYTFTSSQTFGKVVFQEGLHFSDGGWFRTLGVQVRQNGVWVNVPNVTVTPSYPGINTNISYETYAFTFPGFVGDGIRIDGAPGGSATFISVGELRVFASTIIVNQPPVANAGQSQTVTPGATVTLDGSGSADPNGDTITYAWTQTSGPAVTLSSTTAQKPTFVAPSLSSSSLGFSLVVSDGSIFSPAASVTVNVSTVIALTDTTASGTITVSVTAPKGGGSKSTAIMRDGVTPAQGSSNAAQEYDTYTGTTRAEDWFGYTYSASKNWGKVVFQEGMHFSDGGWFTTLKVQVRQSGAWVTVPSVVVTPSYPGINTNISYETYTMTFPLIAGDGIRIDGTPGGSATFTSVGELRVFSQ